MHTAEPAPAPHFRSARRHDGRSTTFCWCMLGLGVALFACGASLVAWSLLGERSELWNVGAPCALAGQVCFLIGLVLQLDVIWQHSKETSRTLDVLDRRLSRWQERSKSLEGKPRPESQRHDVGHSSPAANPQIMLTELRSQLDRLATRISSHDRID